MLKEWKKYFNRTVFSEAVNTYEITVRQSQHLFDDLHYDL